MKQWLGKLLGNFQGFALGRLLPSVVLLLVGLTVIKIVMRIVGKMLQQSSMEKAAHSLIKSAIRIVLYALLVLMVASGLGVDVSGVVALASVLTLAISLSVQDLLSNVFGGFTLLYTHPFSTGDTVEIAGQTGSVKEIGLTYTKLITGDNKLVSIPNSAVVSAEIVNYTANGSRRAEIVVSASYDAPVDKVLEALLAAADWGQVKKEPVPFAAVKEYGDNAISYILRFWSDNKDYWSNYYAVNKRIKEVFDARGIEMTYPHINVHLDK